MRNIVIIIVAVVVIAGGAIWYFMQNTGIPTGTDTSTLPANATDPVARVNGEVITRAQLERTARQIAATQGVADISVLPAETQGLLQEEALNAAISSALAYQAAVAGGYAAADAEIDAQLATTKSQFPTDAEYQAALSAQGITEAEIREQIAKNLATQAYLDATIDTDSIEVTDEEIQTEYDAAVAATSNPDDIPEFEAATAQIEAYLIQQKQQDLINAHVQALRDAAEVEILI